MKPALILLAVVILILAGGFAFLSTWEIPAPSAEVEKVVPNDKLSR